METETDPQTRAIKRFTLKYLERATRDGVTVNNERLRNTETNLNTGRLTNFEKNDLKVKNSKYYRRTLKRGWN